MLTKSIKIYNVQVNAAGTLLSIFQQGAPVRLPGHSQRLEGKRHIRSENRKRTGAAPSTCCVPRASHPLVHAGATQAAKEPVDRLDGAEDQLQAAGGQQGGKQADVELHNVLRLGALAPLPVVGQVTRVAVFKGGGRVSERAFRHVVMKCRLEGAPAGHLSLKGVTQKRTTLQRGPFCKPSTATMKLYRAPATPTAANAMDKNICRKGRCKKGAHAFNVAVQHIVHSY